MTVILRNKIRHLSVFYEKIIQIYKLFTFNFFIKNVKATDCLFTPVCTHGFLKEIASLKKVINYNLNVIINRFFKF